MREYIIKVPIFNTRILLVISDNIDKYAIERELSDKALECQGIVYNVTNLDHINSDFIILLYSDKLYENILVHESFHLAVQILRDLDTPLSEDTEEIYAYLQEWIYKVIRHKTIEFKNGNSNT